jgi:hypothetical protein
MATSVVISVAHRIRIDGSTVGASAVRGPDHCVMNVVVERGVARCPRCAATADYCFTECGADAIRYEISCRHCGEQYREEHAVGATTFDLDVADVAPIPVAPPAARWWQRLLTMTHRNSP